MRSPRGQAPWGKENVVFVWHMSGVILMHILDVILTHTLDVLIRTRILHVLLLLLAGMVIAPLFWGVQPQSNNAAGSVVVPNTAVMSLTTVLKDKYGQSNRTIDRPTARADARPFGRQKQCPCLSGRPTAA